MKHTGFHCSTYGKYHAELPLVLGRPGTRPLGTHCRLRIAPRTAQYSSDQCVIKGEHFFVLGRLEISVLDGDEPFTWLCWVSLSEKNFVSACELWEQEGRESEAPYFAWVQSALPYPGGTLSLKANLITQPLGQRPLVKLQECDHPLHIEQSQGITMARVKQIVEAALHDA